MLPSVVTLNMEDSEQMAKGESQLIRLAATSDLEKRGWVAVEYKGQHVLLTRSGSVIYAVRNICAHRGVPFTFNGEAQIEGCTVTCWAHQYTFDLRTGQCAINPSLSIPTYEVRLEGKDVLVQLPLLDLQGDDE